MGKHNAKCGSIRLAIKGECALDIANMSALANLCKQKPFSTSAQGKGSSCLLPSSLLILSWPGVQCDEEAFEGSPASGGSASQ